MKNLIFAGDSHTGVFHPYSDEILSIYTRGALTMDSFSRGQSEAYRNLVEFLGSVNTRGAALVLCLSEVDIRVHFWRDMPVFASRGMSFDEFLQNKVDSFIDRIAMLAQHLRLQDIILWGAPASQVTSDYDPEDMPATGDNMTRNILTHMLNTCIIKTLSTRQTMLRFATPFYSMVSDDFVTDTSWLRDGVHLKFELKAHCLQFLQPLIERTAIATFAPRFHEMQPARFECLSIFRDQAEINPASFFRTWIQSEQKSGITLNNEFGEFSLLKSLAEVGDQRNFNELVLRKVQ